jgi:hypothetical protein
MSVRTVGTIFLLLGCTAAGFCDRRRKVLRGVGQQREQGAAGRNGFDGGGGALWSCRAEEVKGWRGALHRDREEIFWFQDPTEDDFRRGIGRFLRGRIVGALDNVFLSIGTGKESWCPKAKRKNRSSRTYESVLVDGRKRNLTDRAKETLVPLLLGIDSSAHNLIKKR